MRSILLLGLCLGFFGLSESSTCNCSNTFQINGNLELDKVLKTFLEAMTIKFNEMKDIPGNKLPNESNNRLNQGTSTNANEKPGSASPTYELTLRIYDTNCSKTSGVAPTSPTETTKSPTGKGTTPSHTTLSPTSLPTRSTGIITTTTPTPKTSYPTSPTRSSTSNPTYPHSSSNLPIGKDPITTKTPTQSTSYPKTKSTSSTPNAIGKGTTSTTHSSSILPVEKDPTTTTTPRQTSSHPTHPATTTHSPSTLPVKTTSKTTTTPRQTTSAPKVPAYPTKTINVGIITTTTPSQSTLYPENGTPENFAAVIRWITEIDINRILLILKLIGGVSKIPELTNVWRNNPYSQIFIIFEEYPSPIDPSVPSFEVPSEPDNGELAVPNNPPQSKIPFNLLIFIITHLKNPSNDDGKIKLVIGKVEDVIKEVTNLNYLINGGFKIDLVIKFNTNPNDPNGQNLKSLPDISEPYPEVELPQIPTILLILLKKYIGDPTPYQMEIIIRRLQAILMKVRQFNRFINGRLTINIKFKFITHPNLDHGNTIIFVDSPYQIEIPNVNYGNLPVTLIPLTLQFVFDKYRYIGLTNNGVHTIELIQDIIRRVTNLNGIANSGLKIVLMIKFDKNAIQIDPPIREPMEFYTVVSDDQLPPESMYLLPIYDQPPQIPSLILTLFQRFLHIPNDTKRGRFIWRIVDIVLRIKKLNKLMQGKLTINFKFELVTTQNINQYYPTHIIVEPPGYVYPQETNILTFFQKYLEAHVNIDNIDLNEFSDDLITTNIYKIFRQDTDLSSFELIDLLKGLKGNNGNIAGVTIAFNSTLGNSFQLDPFIVTLQEQIAKLKPMDPESGKLMDLLNLGPGEYKVVGVGVEGDVKHNKILDFLHNKKDKLVHLLHGRKTN